MLDPRREPAGTPRARLLGLGARAILVCVTIGLWNAIAAGRTPTTTTLSITVRRAGDIDVWLVNEDGSGLRRVTDHPAIDTSQSWSPDGERIAFTSRREDEEFGDIFDIRADGTDQRNLTDHPAGDYGAAWAPDGKSLAFVTKRFVAPDIYLMDADGGDQREITHTVWTDSNPAWSPDGTKIAFRSVRDGNEEIYVMDADGQRPRRLTDHPADDNWPTWSRDGRQIAFTSDRDGAIANIHVMDADGANVRQLTRTRAPDRASIPTWSPDGTRIAYIAGRNWRTELYAMDVDGGAVSQITDVVRRFANGQVGGRIAWFDPRVALSTSRLAKRGVMWGWLKRSGRD